MKHPLILWLILLLLVTTLVAAGWADRLCNIIEGFRATSNTPHPLAPAPDSQARVNSGISSTRLEGLVSTSGELLQVGDVSAVTPKPTSTPVSAQGQITPQVVPFLEQTIPHDSFDLTEGHEEPECLSCHSEGRYADIESTCQACHDSPPDFGELSSQSFQDLYQNLGERQLLDAYSLYPDHFGEQCEDCHDPHSWEPVAFDHEGVSECISCHAEDIPTIRVLPDPILLPLISYMPFIEVIEDPDHFPGDCGYCHTSTTDWRDTEYEHDYVLECESCHREQTPEFHYPGLCADCHSNIENWSEAIVNHERLEDCQSCHSGDVSVDHPLGGRPGQCSMCHSTSVWRVGRYAHNVNIKCTVCHSKPSGHFSGNCSQCHNTHTWVPDDYFHSDSRECQRCHSTPENHFPGSCSTCHSIRGWQQISYDHTEVRECAGCHAAPLGHYSGLCSTCHNTANWSEYSFDHIGFLYCIDCHAGDEPPNHYSDDCYACHDVNDWGNASRYHASTSDCLGCHAPPGGHYTGQCSSCHNTISWYAIEFDHSRYPVCTDCHSAPGGHWPGECSSCHNTTDWSDYTFDHTGYNICNACHDRPSGHYRGQCSKCHSTDSWQIITTPTATLAVSPTITSTPTPRTKPGQTSTPTRTPTPTPSPTAPPPQEADLTAAPEPTPTLGATSTPTPPAADIGTPKYELTPILGTLQPEPDLTLTSLPTGTPALQPAEPTIFPILTPRPLPVSTICLPESTLTAVAGASSPQAQGYWQALTRVIDRTIRSIFVSYNSRSDQSEPPTSRRLEPPSER